MTYVLDSSGVNVDGQEITFYLGEVNVTINIKNVIGCQSATAAEMEVSKTETTISQSTATHIVHYSNKKTDHTWTAEKIYLSGCSRSTQHLVQSIEGKLALDTDRPKKLLVLVNPIGGKQNAKSVLKNEVAPLLRLAGITTDVLISERPKHMTEIISSYDLSQVDGVLIFGGDGSIWEVLNHLVVKTQKDAGVNYDDPKSVFATVQKPVGVIPTGTGNATADVLYGVRDTVTAVLHVIKGNRKKRNGLVVYSGGKFLTYAGAAIAYGFFADVMFYTEKQRWLKTLRYAVVPLWMLLMKKRRFFQSKITYYTRKTKESTFPNSDDTIETSIEGKFLNLLSFNGNLMTDTGECDFSNICDRSDFNLWCYKEIGRFGMIGEFVKMFKKDRTTFCHEEIDSYNVVGYKVKVDKLTADVVSGSQESEMDTLFSLLNIDGELIDIIDQEYEVIYKYDVCQFFSSL